jgi:hypothetical protein
MGAIVDKLSGTTLNEIQLVTVQSSFNGTSNFTRLAIHDGNPLSISTLAYVDISLVQPMIFSSSYSVLITSNSIIDPSDGSVRYYSDPFTFNPNGYTWLSHKGYAELILNYDYPFVNMLDTSTGPWVTLEFHIKTNFIDILKVTNK